MPLTHHPLVKEFPHYREQIRQLKMENNRFHKLMDKYEDVDKQVFRIEDGSQPTSDEYVEQLKKERLFLKDQLFELIHDEA